MSVSTILDERVLAEAWEAILADHEIAELATNTSVEAAGGRLGPRAEPDVSNMSGVSPAWRQLKRQVYLLLCTDDAHYAPVRSKANAMGVASKNVGLPTISAYVAAHVGLPEGIIVPFVALTLVASAQIGMGTWCATQIALNPDFGDQVLLPPPKKHDEPPSGNEGGDRAAN